MKKSILICAVLVILVISCSIFAGTLITWGNNDWGQCNFSDANEVSDESFIAIAGGNRHSLAIKSDGSIVASGQNLEGQCNVPDGNDFVAVACGREHSLALKSDGSLVAWGNNYFGQCDVDQRQIYAKIAAGGVDSLALTHDGSLKDWGYCEPNCPMGNGFVEIAAGDGFCLALKSDGSLVGWGQDIYGQLSNMPAGNDFVDIAAGMYFGIAIKKDGSLVAWGRNDCGQCNVPDANDFVDIAAGWYHGIALKADGSIVGWGRNLDGQIDVPEGHGFVAIASGAEHCLALTSDEIITLTIRTDPNYINTIIPGIGTHCCYRDQNIYINAINYTDCPDTYVFNHWEGDIEEPYSASFYLNMDSDKTIIAVYSLGDRICGDKCHPILKGDLNGDCRVNFDDFIIYTTNWLACTHPDCD